MKPSHFTTPRAMEDCQFATNADPFEKPAPHSVAWAGRLFVAAGIAAAVCAIVIVAYGFRA